MYLLRTVRGNITKSQVIQKIVNATDSFVLSGMGTLDDKIIR